MTDTRIGRYTYGPRSTDAAGGVLTPDTADQIEFYGVYEDEPADPVTGITAVRWIADTADEHLARSLARTLDHVDNLPKRRKR